MSVISRLTVQNIAPGRRGESMHFTFPHSLSLDGRSNFVKLFKPAVPEHFRCVFANAQTLTFFFFVLLFEWLLFGGWCFCDRFDDAAFSCFRVGSVVFGTVLGLFVSGNFRGVLFGWFWVFGAGDGDHICVIVEAIGWCVGGFLGVLGVLSVLFATQ